MGPQTHPFDPSIQSHTRLLDHAEGGPNDPRTTFNDLRSWLSAVKEDRGPFTGNVSFVLSFSPWDEG